MPAIDDNEEFARDWDWYAVDPDGNIGHFTTAGLRLLPQSFKSDRDRAETLDNYFHEKAPFRTSCLIREEAAQDSGGWDNLAARERHVKSFRELAEKGLFSYDTQLLHGTGAKYYLVARPHRPLSVAELPVDIRVLLEITRSAARFAESSYIPEDMTETW